MVSFPAAGRRRKKSHKNKKEVNKRVKILITVGLILGAAMTLQSQTALQKDSAVKDETKQLEVLIVTDRQRYNRHDKLTITAMLVNGEYIKDILVYGRLGWGRLSSLT